VSKIRQRCFFAATVVRRVWISARATICSFTGLVLTALGFAIMDAVLVTPAPGTLPQRIAFALIDVAVALVAVTGATFAVHLVRYLRDRDRDRDRGGGEWRTLWFAAGNALMFTVAPAAMPETLATHGIPAVLVTTPQGVTVQPELFNRGWDGFGMIDAPYESGAYVVRWLGSQKRGRFYELRREVCNVTESNGLNLLAAISQVERFGHEVSRV
jgi:hypothetical protein